MSWYYADKKRRRHGPFPDEALAELVGTGQIERDTLVWHTGMNQWVTYGVLLDQQAAESGASTVPVAADIADRSQSVTASARITDAWGGMDYAGFWIRLLAKLIDGVVLNLLYIPVFLVLGGSLFGECIKDFSALLQSGASMNPATIEALSQKWQSQVGQFQWVCALIQIVYTVVFVGTFGGTPGKLALNLRIVTADGEKCGYLRALGRSFAELLSGCCCAIGYIMAAFDSEKRALHDRICATRVVKRH